MRQACWGGLPRPVPPISPRPRPLCTRRTHLPSTPCPGLRTSHPPMVSARGAAQGNSAPRGRKSQGRPPSLIPPTQLLQGAPRDPGPRRSRVPAKYLFSPSAEQVEVSCWKSPLPIERNKHKVLSSDSSAPEQSMLSGHKNVISFQTQALIA